MECCETCKLRYEIQRWNYSNGGCEHTKPEGHVCMAFKGEGIAVWMVGNTGMCEAYTPKEAENRLSAKLIRELAEVDELCMGL